MLRSECVDMSGDIDICGISRGSKLRRVPLETIGKRGGSDEIGKRGINTVP